MLIIGGFVTIFGIEVTETKQKRYVYAMILHISDQS